MSLIEPQIGRSVAYIVFKFKKNLFDLEGSVTEYDCEDDSK